jgi:flagellar assembly protein FliH
VGEEEKISLSKPLNRSSEDRKTGIGLHCFPDIPADESLGDRQCVPNDRNFRRVQYDSIEKTYSGNVSHADNDRTCDIKNGSITTAQLNDQAYQSGFIEGREKGMIEAEHQWHALGEKKIEPLLISLQEGLSQLNNIRKETYQEVEKEVVELALAIAKQVICHEITLNRDTVVCVAREALAKVEDPGNIKIRMSPSDLKFIKETRSQLSDLIENIDNVTLEAEENVQSGGCIIETDLGEIDARIERQMQIVEESFRLAMDKS